jgi:hypothetical protein
MDYNSIYDDIHQIRAIVIQSLQDIGGDGNLHEIHNASKEHVEDGLKISIIHQTLKSLDNIVDVDNSKENNPQPHTYAELTGQEEAETITHFLD